MPLLKICLVGSNSILTRCLLFFLRLNPYRILNCKKRCNRAWRQTCRRRFSLVVSPAVQVRLVRYAASVKGMSWPFAFPRWPAPTQTACVSEVYAGQGNEFFPLEKLPTKFHVPVCSGSVRYGTRNKTQKPRTRTLIGSTLSLAWKTF